MTKLHRRSLFLVAVSLLILLTACARQDPATIIPEISLNANKKDLPGGGEDVLLIVEVLNGAQVDKVSFKAEPALEIADVTAPNEKGEFVTRVRVKQTTKFTAEALGPAGMGASEPNGTLVTVAPLDPDDPFAPDSSADVKGFAGMTLTMAAPVGLSVVAPDIPGVTGEISGQVKAETVKSGKGLDVEIEAGDGVLRFSYPATTRGRDSFEYTVLKGDKEDKGKIFVDIQDVAAVASDVEVIDGSDDADDINGSSKPYVLLTKDVNCTVDRCIRLDEGQTLAGAMTIAGLRVTNSVKPKILASIPNTRKSGTATCLKDENGNTVPGAPPGDFDPYPNCVETNVIVLNDNTTVEHVEITSPDSVTDEANTYFVALFARGDSTSGENVLDGDIKIKDVTINRSNGKPIYIKYTFPSANSSGATPVYGNYNLEIDGLDLNDANDTLVIGNPQKLVFKNSTIDLTQPVGISGGSGPQPFGDNSGVQIVNYNDGGDITLDNVDVFMESPKYRIDFEAPGDNCTPIEIYNHNAYVSSVTTKVLVKNSDITYGTSSLGGNQASFKIQSIGGRVDINSASVNNKSVRGFSAVEREGGIVKGKIVVSR